MSLLYVIDAYNIINHIQFPHRYKKIQDRQRALLEFIKTERLTGSSKNKINVIFDGYPNLSNQKLDEANIKVIFSKDQTADAIIKRIVESSDTPKNIAIISDDKEIIFFVKSLGARSIGVEEFISRKALVHKQEQDALKTELSFSQIDKINQELKARWLRD